MNRLQRAALISEMLNSMINKGSWAGETHLQKCLFFLQTMRGVPTGYEFQIYKYGPFSFDLRDDLVQLRAEGMVELSPRSASYGSSLDVSEASQLLRKRFPRTLEKYKADVAFIADHFGHLNANDLGRLATSFYFHLDDADSSDKEIGQKVHRVKSYISVSDGTKAAQDVRQIAESG